MALWLIVLVAILMVAGCGFFIYSIVCKKDWAFGLSLALFVVAQAIVHLSW